MVALGDLRISRAQYLGTCSPTKFSICSGADVSIDCEVTQGLCPGIRSESLRQNLLVMVAARKFSSERQSRLGSAVLPRHTHRDDAAALHPHLLMMDVATPMAIGRRR